MREAGFSLIELVVIIAILGFVAVVAMPVYKDIHIEARIASVKASLGGFREGISSWQMKRALGDESTIWPPLDTLATIGRVLLHDIPDNPFQAENRAPDSIVLGVTKGVVVGTRGGWAYNPSTGEIWANTSSTVSGSGCSGSQTINENEF